MTEKTRPVRIMLADHRLVNEGLAARLNQEPDFQVAGCTDPSQESVTQEVARVRPDVLNIEINLPGGGLLALKKVREQSPETKILVVSSLSEKFWAKRCLSSGASGYLEKTEPFDKLVTAIHQVMTGEIYLSENDSKRTLFSILRGRSLEHTDKELELLRLTSLCKTATEIAEEMQISRAQVGKIRKRLMGCLLTNRDSELLLYSLSFFSPVHTSSLK